MQWNTQILLGKKLTNLVLDLLLQLVPVCIPSHRSWQNQMEFKSMFMEKFCVISIFLLFKLSFRTGIEVSMICVPFKHFFPNKVFEFLIRLSWSYTLSSLDNFSNVTQSWRWLFFAPFAIGFFSWSLDNFFLHLVCSIVKNSPFSQLLFGFPPCCFEIWQDLKRHPTLICRQNSWKRSAVKRNR